MLPFIHLHPYFSFINDQPAHFIQIFGMERTADIIIDFFPDSKAARIQLLFL